MSAAPTANVHVTNATDGTAYIQLFHRSDSHGSQNASFTVGPRETAGPLSVEFASGPNARGILHWWAVVTAVEGGSAPGIYANTGTAAFPKWAERRLEPSDAGADLTFSVGTTRFDLGADAAGAVDGMTRLSDFSKITNVFVLMLENHSFDNILGQSGIPGIVHATSADSNTYGGTPYPVGDGAPAAMPTDPGHEFEDVVEQLAGEGATYPRGGPYPAIDNAGYAANYATSKTEGPTPPPADIGMIMLGFDTPSDLPNTYKLATSFATCDHWFSSMPGPTWPNRFFLHGASSSGLDHSPTSAQMAWWETFSGFTYPNGSIFGALTKAGLGWRIYNDRIGTVAGAIPQVTSLKGVTLVDARPLVYLATDLQGPYTTQYTLIEPNYGDITNGSYEGGSSQHPMDGVKSGDQLIASVYEAIRSSPLWNTSLLIVTYDEHGGFYDSVPPPPAAPPNDGSDSSSLNQWGFTFDQYGPRVPAVVVSPWIAAGAVDHTVYDHASVLKTLEQLFGLPSLTGRDAAANDVLGLLGPTLRGDAPTTLAEPAAALDAAAQQRTADAQAADDDEPVDVSGNLPGFLAAALGTEIELMGDDPATRAALTTEYAAIRTRGEARARIARVVAMADAARAVADG